jgi:hypothetical protein
MRERRGEVEREERREKREEREKRGREGGERTGGREERRR